MTVHATDFYLNLDRWDTLSSIERHRGYWEERLRGPEVRLDRVRREAMIEAAWAIHARDKRLDRASERALTSPAPPPPGAPGHLVRSWSYIRAAQFVHGWYEAFHWTSDEVGQLCRILGEPSADTIAETAKGVPSLHTQATQVGREIGDVPLVELAIFYGGLRRLQSQRDDHIDPYLLSFRVLLLQKGYVQVLFSPLEAIFMKDEPATSNDHANPPADLEGRVGNWLDEVMRLLDSAGRRAEELWTRNLMATYRSSLQEAIMTLANRNGRVTAGDVLRETCANRNTVKDNLARLVKQGSLKKQGSKRGTVYLPV